ncbi:Acyl-CoA binding protein [Operophtera brumata]|uniref:Acyl-CoA-binding domain-containing protein 6 n=1 Tax=Operophtera brumata TaxID=104452 RepID=A0A0L7LA60_OPEBR|nr:Acyl-CoA binding protein [Operophtera brumata]
MAEALPEYPDSDFSEDDLSPLDKSFNQAAAHVSKITGKLDNNKLLEFYGLFKQGTVGPCDTPKPSWYDGKGRKKWEAWHNIRDMPGDQAKEQYISLVQKYDPEWTIESPTSNFGTKDLWVAVSSLRYSPEPDLVHNELSLLDAARENCGDRVKQLLKKNPELHNERDEDGLTALHWASDRDSTEALKAALDGGCLVNAVDSSGQTALHYAATCGHIESIKILILAGASLIKDEDGKTPLDLAENNEIRKILEGLEVD